MPPLEAAIRFQVLTRGATMMKNAWVTYILLFTLALGGSAAQAQQGSGWTAVTPMSVARLGHSMVELPPGKNALGLSTGAGKVMVIGGFDSEPLDVPHVPANPLASCEIYDPTTNTWTTAAPHPVSAGWRVVAVLSNGMVLVAGGAKSLTSVLASSHLYDPKTNAWIATQPLPVAMTNPHAFMRAIVLPNGQVLIAGGIDQNGINSVNKSTVPPSSTHSYLFTLNSRNPAQSSWDNTRLASDGSISPMPEERTTSALVLMSNGKVLNVGGLGPKFDKTIAATNTASVFDPATGIWTSVTPMPRIAGLGEDELIPSYPTAPGSRWAPFSQLLDSGSVLIAGGLAGLIPNFVMRASAVIYDPVANSWRLTTPMLFRRPYGFWSAKLPSGEGVLFAGPGFNFQNTPPLHDFTGEIFDATTEQWSLSSPSGGPPSDGSIDSFESQSVLLRTGIVQIAGGADGATTSLARNQSWIYKP
jgi:hypothetical protein